MIFSSEFAVEFAVSCFIFKSTAYMASIFPFCPHSFLPLLSPLSVFPGTKFEHKGFGNAKMFYTMELYFWPMALIKLALLFRVSASASFIRKTSFPSALCQHHYPKLNTPFVHNEDTPFSLHSTSMTNCSVAFSPIFGFLDNFIPRYNDF